VVGGGSQLTFKVCALFFAEPRAGFLDPRGQVDLDVLGHDLVGVADLVGGLAFAHHLLDVLDAAVAVMEAARDCLGKLLNFAFLGHFGLIVVEPRQYVLLV
jgi:hypothetical protein